MPLKNIDDILYFGVLLSIVVRWAISCFPYSGAGKPIMFGDYEAQRHWMEITFNLPAKEWYKNSTANNLLYWGLDYPPLTAYHSMLCGYIANLINPDWIALISSRGYESYHHKLFMRSTVLVADLLIFYAPMIIYWTTINKPFKVRDKAIAASLCLLFPSLILIDHGHFQYNCVSLGFTLWAIIFLLWNYDCIGAIFFTCALHYKQMSLYYSIPFFCYLMGKCIKLHWIDGVYKFLKLGLAVIFTSAVCWYPFLSSSEDFVTVLDRLLPFNRGIYEDKVANVWFTLSLFIKLKNIYSCSTLAFLSALTTFIVVLPSSLNLLFNPNMHKFRLALINSSLLFFLFSYQVHEKSILFPALPILLILEDHPLAVTWFTCISTFSLVPLLAKDGCIIPFFALTFLFLIGALRAYKDLLLPLHNDTALLVSLSFLFSCFGCIILIISMFVFKQPFGYPHLHILLNYVYCAFHFVGFAIYFNWLQFIEVPNPLYKAKEKIA